MHRSTCLWTGGWAALVGEPRGLVLLALLGAEAALAYHIRLIHRSLRISLTPPVPAPTPEGEGEGSD